MGTWVLCHHVRKEKAFKDRNKVRVLSMTSLIWSQTLISMVLDKYTQDSFNYLH